MPTRNRLKLCLAGLAISLALSGCGPSKSNPAEEQAAPTVMSVTGAPVTVMPMRRELILLGQTAALRHLTVRSPAAGSVLDVTVQLGDRVHRGEIVAQVVNREVEAARNGLAVARALDPEEAKALAGAVRRNSAGGAIPVAAPEDAIVAQRFVSSGQRVADLDPILDLIDPRSIYVDAAVPAEDLAQLRPGMPVTITSPVAPDVTYGARIASLAPNLNAGGATISARLEFTGSQLIPQAGAPVEAAVTTAAAPAALAVPNAALFQSAADQSWYLFVAANGIAHRRTVILGIRSPRFTQVVSGVAAGETVITSGGYALSDGLHVTVAPAR